MKNPILFTLAFGLMASFSTPFLAVAGEHPCAQIEKACKAAGFEKGKAKEGKGLFKNCMKPIMEGKTVPGVTADATTVQACQEKRNHRRASRPAGQDHPEH